MRTGAGGNQRASVKGHPASSNKHGTNLSWDNRLMIALNKATVAELPTQMLCPEVIW